ncbi:MAG: hybrid sensor histidine kinase/response regulator [Rhizobiales bacterium]|nr:hybrid sensor histidine kinase/response regulator [Hyphomicrobiales bacterium]OJY44748.1 MAG: hybrid sensor histidine kinase/response regulator [Rhizobiales bacterium 64-17]
MDDLLREFLTETHESLDVVDVELVRFEQEPNNAKILANIFRLVHTIKGTCGFLGLPRLEALSHAAETLMGKFRDGAPATAAAVTLILATIDRLKLILAGLEHDQQEPPGGDGDLIAELERMAAVAADPSAAAAAAAIPLAAEPETAGAGAHAAATEEATDDASSGRVANHSIRVTVDTLEHLMTMVSELVLTRNQLLEIARQNDDNAFKTPLQRLSNVTAELQEGVMKTRMQPIGNAWQKLPRIVRDLAHDLGKEIELDLHGEQTELDRQVLDLVKDPLTHMVRNSADHGLETRAERIAAGKPAKGHIRLSAYQEGGQIVIEVADDGRGLNTARIKAKALSLGVATDDALAKMSDAQVHKLIFAPGFSTADQVTAISGRGVGMDVVRANIDQIGGMIDVKSVPGAGVSFIIKIPLTLAIVSALIVQSGGHRFAIPQIAVAELVKVRDGSDNRIEHIKDTPVLRLRNKLLPLADLSRLLRIDGTDARGGKGEFIVVTQVDGRSFGIAVDQVFHTEEIVVKPMSSRLRHITAFCGNTILGDGAVIMIVDPNGIGRMMGATVTADMGMIDAVEDEQVGRTDNITSLLVFRAGSAHPKAVPLSLVTRLEEVDVDTIEVSNGRHMVQYRGHLMPLVTLTANAAIKPEGTQPLLVFSDGTRSMALVVDEIVDIVEERLDIEVASETAGVIGSAVVKGQATEIIDVGHFLPLACEDWFRGKSVAASEHKRRSLLLVDDSPFFRNMLTPVLQAAGYDVITAADGSEALAHLRDGKTVDIVITDIDMPQMDGFALAEAVRQEPATAAVPVIALSSHVSVAAIERGREVGLHDYVAKFDRAGLIAALKEHAAGSEAA